MSQPSTPKRHHSQMLSESSSFIVPHSSPLATITNLAGSPLLSPQKSRDRFGFASPLSKGKKKYEHLLDTLSTVWDEQRRINVANMRMNCVNLFANYANLHNNQKLKVKQEGMEKELHQGKQKLRVMDQDLTQQKHKVLELNGTVEELEEDVQEQKEKLGQVEQQYQASVTHLEESLSKYSNLLKEHEQIKFKEDLAMDVLLTLTSLWAVNTKTVKLPLKLVLNIIGINKRKHKIILMVASKMLLLVGMVISSRQMLMKYNLHSNIGSFSSYLLRILTYIFKRQVIRGLRLA